MPKSNDKTDMKGAGEKDSLADISHLTIAEAQALGLQHQDSGNLSQAEGIYRQILEIDPGHPGALHLLGVIGFQAGKFDEAAGLIERAIALSPEDANAHNNLGQVYENLGRLDDAEMVYRKATTLISDFAEAQTNLGNVLSEKGELTEASKCHLRALEINPDNPEVLCNLGGVLLSQGKTEEGIANIYRAHEIAPDQPMILFNLGNALRGVGKLEEAADFYQRALEINPGDPEVLSNLSKTFYGLYLVFNDQGQLEKALQAIRQALNLFPEDLGYWEKWEKNISRMGKVVIDDQLLQELETYLALEIAKVDKIVPFVQEILLRIERLGELRLLAEGGDIPALADNLARGDGLRAVSIPLIMQCLSLSRLTSVKLELLFTAVRRAFLYLAQEKQLEQIVAAQNGLGFLTSLAKQCFLNEYVFFETDEETKQVEALVLTITKALEKGVWEGEALLALLSCYRPLGCLDNAANLLEWRNFTNEFQLGEVLQQQISEPLEEQKIRTLIPHLTKIDDEVSLMVRGQYEENPYPRWIKTSLADNGRAIGAVLQGAPLRLDLGAYQSPESPEILVAGCGTGQHALKTASRFSNARVLAVDLSLSSLSYALRRTKELDFSNIEYAQGDIMELGNLGRQFDLIESVGVLHHLGDPLAGWRVLVDLLRPQGLMKIGLYSETARQDVIFGRSMIAKKGYTTSPEDIRRCRQDIITKAESGNREMSEICNRRDFFSLSTCRDLLFHVQEHRFTLPQIEANLLSLNLKFLGFEFQDQCALKKFGKSHPEMGALTSLALWHKFEIENPNTFRSMYQFWCKKM